MTWSYAHRYYGALHAIEDELDESGNGIVQWRAEYSEIFGDRDQLLLALRHRWKLLVQAQIEHPWDATGHPSAELVDLAATHPGLLLALARTGGRVRHLSRVAATHAPALATAGAA